MFGWWSDFLEWLKEFPLWLLGKLLDALATVIEAIPVPGWITELPVYIALVSGGIWWLLGILEFGWGLSVVIGAFTIRWVIRRLPVIG